MKNKKRQVAIAPIDLSSPSSIFIRLPANNTPKITVKIKSIVEVFAFINAPIPKKTISIVPDKSSRQPIFFSNLVEKLYII